MSFPYIVITKEDRDKGFNDLQNLKVHTLELKHSGSQASNYYFQKYRIKTKKGKYSHFELWNIPEKRKKIIEIDKKIHRNSPSTIGTPRGLQSAMTMWFSSIPQFKPYVAVYIYQKFKPRRILDISAGWGDRLIAAMSKNIDYIGIDSNKNLKTPYNEMINDFKNKSSSKVNMIFEKSQNVNYSILPKYDLIFTSPPYYKKEIYEHMEDFKNYESFIDTYFAPTIKKAYNSLLKGGYIVLNMPNEMYQSIRYILGPARILKMPINNRFSTNDPTRRASENIYYWKK